MPRIEPIELDSASAEQSSLLDEAKQAEGQVVNFHRTVAASPAALRAYLRMSGALGQGELDPRTQEAIAIGVSDANGCSY